MTRFAALLVALRLCLAPSPASAQGIGSVTGSKVVTIDVLDVGRGDSIPIRSPEGKTALIDAGPSHQVVELLKATACQIDRLRGRVTSPRRPERRNGRHDPGIQASDLPGHGLIHTRRRTTSSC